MVAKGWSISAESSAISKKSSLSPANPGMLVSAQKIDAFMRLIRAI